MAPTTPTEVLTSALVARFLRTNDYSDTLKAFINEADLASDVGQSSGDDTNNLTIQGLLEEKKAYDHSVNLERYGKDSKETALWSEPGKIQVVTCFVICTSRLEQIYATQTITWHVLTD